MIKILEEKDNFDDIISSGKWLVDFYADWCGPCRMLLQVLEKVDFIDILKVNVDSFPEIAKSFGVMSIPTVFYLNDGDIVDKRIGLQTIEDIKASVDKMK